MGNCGVGFAPARPDRHDWLIGLMEGVEDIPGTALAEGIEWEWETFPEYLDALERRRWTVDVGTQVPHGAVRAYVMGERGAQQRAGHAPTTSRPCGPSCSRRSAPARSASPPRAPWGTAPSTASWSPAPTPPRTSCSASASALGEAGTGVFELAPLGSAGEMLEDAWQEVDWMRRLSAAIDRPVSYVLLQADDDPELWRKQLAASLEACAEGAQLYPQIAGRPTGILSGHHATLCLFSDIPGLRELRARCASPAELGGGAGRPRGPPRRSCRGRPRRRPQAEAMEKAYERTFVLGDPPDYEPGPERSLAGLAAARGMTPLEVAYDEMARDGGQGLLYLPILNYATGDLDHVHEMMLHPQGLLGLSDGGAHTGTICDASMPTFMLTHWTRDRSRGATLPLEYVVKKQTHDTARLYGMSDRGTVEPGALGDLNLIDYEGLTLGAPFVRATCRPAAAGCSRRPRGTWPPSRRGPSPSRTASRPASCPGRLVRGAR